MAASHFHSKNPRPAQAKVLAAYGGRPTNRGLAPAINLDRNNMQFKFPELLMSRLGRTATGRAWAMTALHPCGKGELISPLLGDLVGMPDTMTGAVVNPCYPGETYINFDTTLFAEGTLPTELAGTWGIDIVVPPIPEIDYMYRVLYDAGNLRSRWRVVRLPNMDLPPLNYDPAGGTAYNQYTTSTRGTTFASLGYGKARAIGVGHTFELDASATNNQGRVVAAQIEGQWTFDDFTTTDIAVSTGSFVTDVGPPVVTGVAVTTANALTTAATTKLAILSVPTDPQTLIAACPSSYQADAKFGAYSVTKFASPLLGYQFKNTGGDYSVPVAGSGADVAIGAPATGFGIVTDGYNISSPNINNLEAFTPGSGYTTDAVYSTIGDGQDGNTIHPWVSQPSDMMTNVVMFRNLALGTANAISSNSVVHVKSRNYFECVPNAQNPATTPFTHSPAQYDYAALDAVITVGKQLSDAYPASANDLGEMIGTIWDGVKEIAEPIAKTIGGWGIPVVSNIAKEIGSSIHSNADALNARMQQLRHLSNNTHVRSLLGSR